MPYVMRKLVGKNLYSVRNTETGVFHMKAGTKTAAERQLRLLRGIDHGLVPRRRRTVKVRAHTVHLADGHLIRRHAHVRSKPRR